MSNFDPQNLYEETGNRLMLRRGSMLLDSLNISLEFGDGFPLTLGTLPQICFFFKQIFLGIGPYKVSNFPSDDAEFNPLSESAKKSGVSLPIF
jgi:hypothetical protein